MASPCWPRPSHEREMGGLATSFLLELLVYPAVYLPWRWHTEVKGAARV